MDEPNTCRVQQFDEYGKTMGTCPDPVTEVDGLCTRHSGMFTHRQKSDETLKERGVRRTEELRSKRVLWCSVDDCSKDRRGGSAYCVDHSPQPMIAEGLLPRLCDYEQCSKAVISEGDGTRCERHYVMQSVPPMPEPPPMPKENPNVKDCRRMEVGMWSFEWERGGVQLTIRSAMDDRRLMSPFTHEIAALRDALDLVLSETSEVSE